jgi:hypothetical protein
VVEGVGDTGGGAMPAFAHAVAAAAEATVATKLLRVVMGLLVGSILN